MKLPGFLLVVPAVTYKNTTTQNTAREAHNNANGNRNIITTTMSRSSTTANHPQPAGQASSYCQKHYEEHEDVWVGLVKNAVSKQLFDDVQFITCDRHEVYGSEWQKAVCAKLPAVTGEYAETFWKRKGMTEARKALNRRRQNTNTAMKRTFLGKYSCRRDDGAES